MMANRALGACLRAPSIFARHFPGERTGNSHSFREKEVLQAGALVNEEGFTPKQSLPENDTLRGSKQNAV